MSSSVDQIKSKIDIVSVVSAYIQLEKAGTNFKGKCPFHNEKTPSFFVSPDRGSYYCFGCHAKGDIFTFVQEFEGLDFMGALKILADKAGVVLERGGEKGSTEKERLFSVLEQACFFYEKQLSENKQAYEYVVKRGITDKTIKDFRIGFALPEWRGLSDFLQKKDVSEKDMRAVGLVKQKEGSTSVYDTFRGRIMFPILDSSSRVVGFSGRIIVPDENAPKYLNSPETELFKKSEILFGLDKAKKSIRERDYSILVEGQMDLVMMHQIGITNTVASSGTALTIDHLTKLRRLSNRIIMAFDGDNAGFSASNRSGEMALSLGMELKLAELPEGQDPADLAKDNPEQLIAILKDTKHIIDFYTDKLLARNLDSRELGMEIQKNVLPLVAILPSAIERAHFIKTISQKTFIKEDALWDDLKKVGSEKAGVYTPQTDKAVPKIQRTDSIERKLIGIIFWQESQGEKNIHSERIRNAFIKIKDEGYVTEKEKELEKDKETLLFETEAYYNNTNIEADIEELLYTLAVDNLKEQFSETMALLQKAEQTRNSGEVLKYLEQCQRISQELNILKKAYEKKQ